MRHRIVKLQGINSESTLLTPIWHMFKYLEGCMVEIHRRDLSGLVPSVLEFKCCFDVVFLLPLSFTG